jgi:hypothetical protein
MGQRPIGFLQGLEPPMMAMVTNFKALTCSLYGQLSLRRIARLKEYRDMYDNKTVAYSPSRRRAEDKLMLYNAYEMQRSLLSGASAWASVMAETLTNPANPMAALGLGQVMASALMFFRMLQCLVVNPVSTSKR